ncbi:MAG: hypothetical protein SNJ71_05375, partial [Bacteroidales bacterium]
MTFGKNRIQYKDFFWQYYRYPLFDVYFHEGGKELALHVCKKAEEYIAEIESKVGFNYDRRILFVVYANHTDYKQSNIGETWTNEHYNIGGITKIVDNKLIIYYEGDHTKLDAQIKNGIAQILISEMLLSNGSFRDIITGTAYSGYPLWYVDGLTAYLAGQWDAKQMDYLNEIIYSQKFKTFHNTEPFNQTVLGYAFWLYVTEKHGTDAIQNILFISSMTKNWVRGFQYVLGMSPRECATDFVLFYKEKFTNDTTPQHYTGKLKKNGIATNVKISPQGTHLCYVHNNKGKYKLWLVNLETGKKRLLLKREHKLERTTDFSHPIVAWHPSGKLVSVIFEEKNDIWLHSYPIDENEEHLSRKMLYFQKILHFNYSPNGLQLVLSAVKNGQTDIYIHDLVSRTNKQITNDLADDLFPIYSTDGTAVLFCSNRVSDSLTATEIQPHFDIFSYSIYSQTQFLKRLTSTKYDTEIQPIVSAA